MVKRIQELSAHSKVRVTGCLPPVSGGTLESENIEVIKPREIRSFYQGYLDDVEIREPSVFEGIPINQGCTGSCNYCISHMARGKLLSRPVQKIVSQAMMQIERGIMEVRISSLDTAAYGRDLGIRLPELVDAITGIQGDAKFLEVCKVIVVSFLCSPDVFLRTVASLVPTFLAISALDILASYLRKQIICIQFREESQDLSIQ